MASRNSEPLPPSRGHHAPVERASVDGGSYKSISNVSAVSESPSGNNNVHRQIRLTWVRQRVQRFAITRPTSSLYSSIRSLLSTRSSIATISSTKPGRKSPEGQSPRYAASQECSQSYNGKITRFCCQYHHTCLHREVHRWLSGGSSLVSNGSTTSLFDAPVSNTPRILDKAERDVFNNTVLHIAALWGSSLQNIKILLKSCHPDIVNAKNIDGDTFMHILARQGHQRTELNEFDQTPLCELVTMAGDRGYLFHVCDRQGLNVLTSLVPGSVGMPPVNIRRDIVREFDDLLKIRPEVLTKSLKTIQQGKRLSSHILGYLESQSQQYLIEQFPFTYYYLCTNITDKYTELTNDPLAVYYSPDISMVNDCLERIVSQSSSPRSATVLPYHDELIALEIGEQPTLTFWHKWLRATLQDGADPNEYNPDGLTYLMAVVTYVQSNYITEEYGMKILNDLLEFKADHRLVDARGCTALHYAVESSLADLACLLIKRGASVHVENEQNKSPMSLAMEKYHLSRRDKTQKSYASMQKMIIQMFGAVDNNEDKVSFLTCGASDWRNSLESLLPRIPESSHS